MKRFAFSLEKLLAYRAYKEQQWEIKLGEAAGQCIALEQQISGCKERKQKTLLARKSLSHDESGAGFAEYGVIELFILRMDNEIQTINKKLHKSEKKREEIRKDFLEASKKRKVLSKLKERRAAEYYKIKLNEESKVLDEIGANLFGRKTGPGGNV